MPFKSAQALLGSVSLIGEAGAVGQGIDPINICRATSLCDGVTGESYTNLARGRAMNEEVVLLAGKEGLLSL